MNWIMSRPVNQEQRKEREAQILTAALQVFRDRGYGATRLDDIASAAGLTKPALYFYFKNKEALFKAVIRSLAHRPLPEAQRLLEADFATSEARLDAIIDMIYAAITPETIGTMIPLISQSLTLFPDVTTYLREEVFGKLDQVLLTAIRQGEESGEFRKTALSDYTELTIGPAISLAMRQGILGGASSGKPPDLEAYKLAHFEMLLNHLKPGR